MFKERTTQTQGKRETQTTTKNRGSGYDDYAKDCEVVGWFG